MTDKGSGVRVIIFRVMGGGREGGFGYQEK